MTELRNLLCKFIWTRTTVLFVLVFMLALRPDNGTGKGDNGSGMPGTDAVTIFMCGDVMTGRGIDQILPHPGSPQLHEVYVKNARRYIEITEQVNGKIHRPVSNTYIWGEALTELDRVAPDVRIINLETSITRSNDFWPGKGIHYRMHPGNVSCLNSAKIDVCALANNHILDWGYAGLAETLCSLNEAEIKSAGAGHNLQQASAPALVEVAGKGRVLVFSFGSETSGVPISWAATDEKAGVNLIKETKEETFHRIKRKVDEVKQVNGVVVASIHWGSNWGYHVPNEQRSLAHNLIDHAGIDIIHGHSSHHVKGIEVYNGKLILYSCGDFLNDYEGIGGHEAFRPDLALMYFASVHPLSGKLLRLQMTPTQIKRLQVTLADKNDALWLKETLNREGEKFGTKVVLDQNNRLVLENT